MKKLLLLALLALTAIAGCKKEDPPDAGFTAPATAYLTELITFTSTCKYADRILWDFGDGWTSTGKVVQHYYKTNGTYTVSVTAENEAGKDIYSQQIIISWGRAEFNILNKSSWGVYFITCKYGNSYIEYKEHGYIPFNDSSEYTLTNEPLLGMGGKILDVIFVCVYPFPITYYQKNHLCLYDTTTIYTGSSSTEINRDIKRQIQDLPSLP